MAVTHQIEAAANGRIWAREPQVRRVF